MLRNAAITGRGIVSEDDGCTDACGGGCLAAPVEHQFVVEVPQQAFGAGSHDGPLIVGITPIEYELRHANTIARDQAS